MSSEIPKCKACGGAGQLFKGGMLGVPPLPYDCGGCEGIGLDLAAIRALVAFKERADGARRYPTPIGGDYIFVSDLYPTSTESERV